MSCSDSFSPRPYRDPLDEVDPSERTKKEVGKDAWESSEAVVHAGYLFKLQFLSHFHGQRSSFSSFARLASAIEHQTLHIELPAVKNPRVTKPEDDGNAVGPPGASVDARRSEKEYWALVYQAEAPLLGYVHISSLKRRKASSSMMRTGRQDKTVTVASFDEDGLKVGPKNVAKVKDAIDGTPAVSGALEPEI